MAQHDTKPATSPSMAIFLMLNGLGYLLLVIGLIAIVAMNPINWIGVGLAWVAGIYSLVMSRVIRRREMNRS